MPVVPHCPDCSRLRPWPDLLLDSIGKHTFLSKDEVGLARLYAAWNPLLPCSEILGVSLSSRAPVFLSLYRFYVLGWPSSLESTQARLCEFDWQSAVWVLLLFTWIPVHLWAFFSDGEVATHVERYNRRLYVTLCARVDIGLCPFVVDILQVLDHRGHFCEASFHLCHSSLTFI